MLETGFELEQQEALALLFENFWIIREQDPAGYQLIRENEKALRRYISEKFGFSLIIHKDFIKLEKVPFQPRNWMEFKSFKIQETMQFFVVVWPILKDVRWM